MAEKKISGLTAKGNPLETTDLLIISESDGSGGYNSKYVTGAEINNFSINTQTDHYTFALSDVHKLVELNHSGTKTFSIPTSSSVAFPIGTEIKVAQLGTGQLRIAALSGTGAQTINSSGGKTKIAAQYGVAQLIKRSADEWYLFGDLTT